MRFQSPVASLVWIKQAELRDSPFLPARRGKAQLKEKRNEAR